MRYIVNSLMAKKSLSILFWLMAFAPFAMAQDAEWSNPEKFRNRTAYTKVLGQNTSGIYILRSRSRYIDRKVYVQMYKENLGLVYNKLLPGMKRASFKEGYTTPDGFCIYKSRYNGRTNTIDLFAQDYKADAEPAGDEKLISSAPQRDFADEGDFVVKTSIDKTKVMCFHTEITGTKTTVIEIVILNAADRQEISRKKVELPYNYGSFNPSVMEVANDGNAYFIYRVENETKPKKTPERYGYYLYAYNAKDNSLKDFYMNPKDAYISRPFLAIDYITQKVIATAYYSYEDDGYSKGVLYFGLGLGTQALLYSSLMPYPKELVADILGVSAANRGGELRDFFIKKIIPKSDSSFILIGEEYYTTSQTYTFSINGMMQVGSRDVYNYGKVVVLNVDKHGLIEWGKVINKIQSSSLDYGYYSSIYTVSVKNKVYILFNDDERGDTEITQYSLDNEGKTTTRLLFKNQSESLALVPREGMQLDAITVIFPAAKDRKFSFLKLFLN